MKVVAFFIDRSKTSDHHLEWKVRIFSVAAVLGLGGMFFEERWMGVVAIALLASTLLLRFLPDRDDAHPSGLDPAEDTDDGTERADRG